MPLECPKFIIKDYILANIRKPIPIETWQFRGCEERLRAPLANEFASKFNGPVV